MSWLQLHGKAHDKAVSSGASRSRPHHIDFPAEQGSCSTSAAAAARSARRPAAAPGRRYRGIDVMSHQHRIPVTELDGNHPVPDRHFDIARSSTLYTIPTPRRSWRSPSRYEQRPLHQDISATASADSPFDSGLVRLCRPRLSLPYNYLSSTKAQCLEGAGFKVDGMIERVGLYPAPFSWLFDRKLHFVAHVS